MMDKKSLEAELFSLRDAEYGRFNARLIPTVDPSCVIGVRTPDCRRIAKLLAADPYCGEFLRDLPHRWHEENNIHGYVIEGLGDFERALEEIGRFLPYIDNWATCDTIAPRVFRRHIPELLPHIGKWLASGSTYTVRFAISVLMKFCLDDAFRAVFPEMVAAVQSDEYYVIMMQAWYFQAGFVKQREAFLPWFTGTAGHTGQLPPRVLDKAIQKCCESLRVSAADKELLRGLKRPH